MFIKQTLLYLPAQLSSTIVQFLAVIAWTHFLEPSEFGKLNLIIAIHEFLFLIMMWWWTIYTLRSLDQWSEGEKKARFERTESAVLLAALVLHVILVTALVIVTVDWSASSGLIAASVAFAISRSLVIHLSERTRTAQKIGLFTILQISWSVIGFLIGLVLVLVLGGSAVWPLVGIAVAQLGAAAYVMWRVRLRPYYLWPDREILITAAKFGFPMVGAGLFGWLSMYGNRFIIEYFLGHAAVGLFAVGNGLADRSVTLAMTLVGTATLPLAIQDMREKGVGPAMERLKVGTTAALALMVPAAVGVTVLAGPIADILVGAAYREATLLILPVAALSAAIYGAWCVLPAQTLILLDRPSVLVKAAASVALISTVLSILLVMPLDIYGVALARAIALALVFVVMCRICMSQFGMLFPIIELLKLLACAAVMALVLLAIAPPRTLVGLVAHILLGGAVYVAAAAVLFRNDVRPLLEGLRARVGQLGSNAGLPGDIPGK